MFPFFSRMFPSTNLQDLNLDWICRRIMELSKGIIAPWINSANQHWMVYDTQAETFVDSGVSAAGEGTGPQGEPGKSPIIGSNGNWYTWDETTQAYVDTQIPARGEDGEDGASAYEEAVQGGYTGSESQFINDLADVSEKLPISAASYTIIGKQSSSAIPTGSYVYLQNSTITGLSDGLYRAAAAITAQTDIASSDLAPVSTNGFNDLAARKMEMASLLGPISAGDSATTPFLGTNTLYLLITSAASAERFGMYIVLSRNNGSVLIVPVLAGDSATMTGSNNTITVTNTAASGSLSVEYFRYY